MRRILSVRVLVLSAVAALLGVGLAHAQGVHSSEPPAADATADRPGAKLYAARCASCHDNPVDRIPPLAYLAVAKTPNQVIRSLTTGVMQPMAAGLSADQIKTLATFITHQEPLPEPDPNANRCSAAAKPLRASAGDWPVWGGDAGASRRQLKAGFSAADVSRLKVKWVFAYPGNLADGQPTVFGDRVFVGNRTGRVFSLDADTGCTRWWADAEAGVRAAISIGALPNAKRIAAFFTAENGFVHAVDANDGAPIWKARVADHPLIRISGSPVLYKDRLYVPISSLEEVALSDPKYPCCTLRGGVVALDAASGKVVWAAHTIADEARSIGKSPGGVPMFGPAGASVFSPPTIDAKRKLIYVGTGNSHSQVSDQAANAVIAFDLATGDRRWVTQVTPKDDTCAGALRPDGCAHVGPDWGFAAPPALATVGGKDVVVAVSKDGEAYGFAPDDGRLLWNLKLKPGDSQSPGGPWGVTVDGRNLYVGGADLNPAPGVVVGGVYAVDIATGKLAWHQPPPPAACSWGDSPGKSATLYQMVTCTEAQPSALVMIPGVVFAGSVDGHIRGYAATDGKIIWDFDTGIPFPAVDGVTANGGSMNYGALAIGGGALYVNSGGGGNHRSGDALIAFTVDGR